MAEPKRRILVVEDDTRIRDIMKWILEKAGYEVAVAGDGPEGVSAAIASPPDVVLLDVMMPGLSGFDVCRELKAKDSTRGVPVVFVSARSGERSWEAARELGATGYLEKPFRSETLIAVVKEVLGRKAG
jgi:DNA-binding response OmpR family regulator